MKLHIVIYTLLVATLCMGCDGRIEMRQMQEPAVYLNGVLFPLRRL